jgi:DNA-directed RNA polymerase subunit beta'
MSTPGMFKDGRGRLIPMFVRRSFAEGLKPWEYYGGTFGARAGAISTKLAVPDAGDLGKQLSVAASDLIITSNDCGTTAAVPFNVDDDDNIGAVLARDVGGFKAGSVVDRKILDALKRKGVDKVLLRSPVTCGMKEGLCKICAGTRDGGKFPNLRDNIGILASSPLSERIAQGSLNVKHTASAGGAKSDSQYSGFPVIDQLMQVPEAFRHRAALASAGGAVDRVEEAPQGGFNIIIDGNPHYVDAEQTVEVKAGDVVEVGDQLSSGIVNPAEVVQYKGVGEGRKYLAERLTKAFRDSKLTINRRNAEVVARAVINRVDIDDPDGLGDYLPSDSVAYNALAYSYVPRADSKVIKPKDAVGVYLEQPALHYTIGTRLTKKMTDELDKFGVTGVTVNTTAPGFTPVMERLRSAPAAIRKDWIAKMQGGYLKANLMQDIQTGAESNIHSVHPAPGLAYGVEFGKSRKGETTY